MKCPECGKKVKGFSKFCMHCGKELKNIINKDTKKLIDKKKVNIPTWVIIVVPIALTIVILLFMQWGSSSFSSSTESSYTTPSRNCRTIQEPYQEEYQESIPYTDRKCESKNLVYSITDFENVGGCIDYDERCLDYTFGICTEKEKYCVKSQVRSNLKLNNLDDESGMWVITFSYTLNGQTADSSGVSKQLYPKTSETAGVVWTIEGEENNKKDDKYSYSVSSIPKKQVCRDVIDYKTITKYRTAYRSKEVCD